MNTKKNITIICNYDPRPNRIGGMDLFFKNYNKLLLENNYNVLWMFHKFEYFNFYKDFNVLIPENGNSLTTTFLEYSSANNYIPEIIVTHFLETINSFYKTCKKLGVQNIFTVDHMPRPLEGYALPKKIKKRIKGFLYAKYTDKIIGVSRYIISMTKIDYGSKASKKVSVIHNGIDVDKFLYKKDFSASAKIKCIVPTNLRPEKGIQDLITAVSLLEDNIKNKLIIDVYGTGTYEDSLKSMVNDKSLENCIKFKGSTTKLPELYHLYDYTLQPTYMEVFSLTILESLASNVPVITTPVGGNLEVVTHKENGIIVKPKDILALKEVLTKLVKKELEIKQKHTRTLIETSFSIEQMVNKHFNLIHCI